MTYPLYFCCHDDYADVNNHNADNVTIYKAYQLYSSLGYPGTNSGEEFENDIMGGFKKWYSRQVQNGIFPVLQNDVVYLPEDPILGGSDCANFTETEDGVLNAADMTYFIAHQMYYSIGMPYTGTGEEFEGDRFGGFVKWFNKQVEQGAYAPQSFDVKHLPSLQNETIVYSERGDINRTCCDATGEDKLWIGFTGNGLYSDFYEVAMNEDEGFSKFTFVSETYGTEIYNWMNGRISNVQGVALMTSPAKPNVSNGINHCEQHDSYNSSKLNFNCDGIFNSGHGTNTDQVNLRFKAYNNQKQSSIRKYGSFDHTHGYLETGKPWNGANMIYTAPVFTSLVIDDSGNNSVDIDYFYFIRETDDDAKIKLSEGLNGNSICNVS